MPITLDGTNGITTPTYGGADTSEYLVPVTAFKNRIINGNMSIDQRNAGASVTINNNSAWVFSVDRFSAIGQPTDGVFTVQRSTVAPTGFTNSLLATVTTADASIGSTQFYMMRQTIEGFNTADFGWGTANAKTVTLSFWVRSSVTGTFGGWIRNNDASRSYPFSYTISAANTWEYKTITISGDTTGTWTTNNTIGVEVGWSLGAGSSRVTTANAWAAGTFDGVTGQTNLIATNGATFYITGVQLEVGSTATSFDYRPYGTELALCQRYYWKNFPQLAGATLSTGGAFGDALSVVAAFSFPVTMRASPTCSQSNTSVANGAVGSATASLGGAALGVDGGYQIVTGSSASFTAGQGGYMYATNTSGFVAFSAEL